MTAPVVPSNLVDSMICARCDGQMVITEDALGRKRRRCPRCDGVSRVKHHPDEVLVPQTLVRMTAAALPPVEPGQLRCQLCAKGVEGNVRFHPECAAAFERAKKQRRCSCGAVFVRPQGSRAEDCPRCLEQRRAPVSTQLCTGCNRIRPRGKRQRRVVSQCDACRPPAPVRLPRRSTPKPPAIREGCGHPYPRRRGRRTRECETCLALAAATTSARAGKSRR